jgi:predicted nucleotidyltransferase
MSTSLGNYVKRVRIKVEYGQLQEMATAFGVRALGILPANSLLRTYKERLCSVVKTYYRPP